MALIPGVKNRAPDSVSRYPTGTHNPHKMILPDNIHFIVEGITTPLVTIPSQLMAGISLDDQMASAHMEDKLQESPPQAQSPGNRSRSSPHQMIQ